MLSSSAPVPVSATVALATGIWSCTFDKPLIAGSVDFMNWSMRATNVRRTVTSAFASGSSVGGGSAAGPPDVGTDEIDFAPPPFDVLSLASEPALAFAGFPLVVT